MPWIKEILKAKLPAGDLRSVDLAGHGLYWDSTKNRYVLYNPVTQQTRPWNKAGQQPRQAPVGHWVHV